MTEAGNYAILYMEVILMFKINPYRPGAGLTPAYLAGRDDDILAVDQMFEALKMNIPPAVHYFQWTAGGWKNRIDKQTSKNAEEYSQWCHSQSFEENNTERKEH